MFPRASRITHSAYIRRDDVRRAGEGLPGRLTRANQRAAAGTKIGGSRPCRLMSWGRAAERLGSVGGGVARIAGARLAPTPPTGGMRGESPLVGSRDGGAGTAVSSSAGAGAALGPWERDVRRPTRAPLCASDAPALLRRFWKWMGYDAAASLPCLFTANSSSNPAPKCENQPERALPSFLPSSRSRALARERYP